MIDVDRVRSETRGRPGLIHLNNAGASLSPAPVLGAVVDYLQLEAEVGGYEAAAQRHESVNRVYGAAASLLRCEPDEIAFVENATRAWDMAFYSFEFQAGDRILTCAAEYVSNYVAYLQVARRTGAVIEVIPDDESGAVSVDALAAMLDERVKLVSVTHVPTNGGLVSPAEEIGAVTRAAGVPFLLDACQSAGQLDLDVGKVQCDLLSLTGRKYLRGPRGTGLLYARRELAQALHPPMIDLHAAPWVEADRYELRPDARRFENWECNFAGKVGLGVAIDYALELGLDAIEQRVCGLATRLRESLSEIRGVSVHDLGRRRCGIVTFTVSGLDAEGVKQALASRSINVSVSVVGSTRIDMERRGLPAVVRASVHYYNTEDELRRLCAEVGALAQSR
ncbi:MAG: aminotransferase class V-fold PLP-dependent enzyme [Solirubrobacterales bacterium]|nr:aminotransferase class V-fold PLP-dependent enzyme [Solirubrobacterales bacterium]